MSKHYEQAIHYLSQFYNRTINRKDKHHVHIMSELLELCEINLAEFEFVQIAGSCGKGSTSNLISSVLQQNDIEHGLFTGPHLMNYEERFRINSRQIDAKEFSSLVLEIGNKLQAYPRFHEVGHMHIMVLIALLFFKNNQIKLVIFENGVGGASDPSNLFRPVIAVLTEITLDHCHLLGNSIEEITNDKIQIIKETTPFVVCGMHNPAAKSILLDLESTTNHTFVFYKRDYHSKRIENNSLFCQFDYRGQEFTLRGIKLPLIGEHQIQNASNALAVIELLSKLGYVFELEKIRNGLEHISIPCRMEMVTHNEVQFLFDGAHNSLELLTLKNNINSLNLTISKIILTISSNKDIHDMIHSIYLEGTEILLVPNPFIERRVSFGQITTYLDTLENVKYRTFENMEASLRYLYQDVENKNGIILVTGSLYLVGAIKNLVTKGDYSF